MPIRVGPGAKKRERPTGGGESRPSIGIRELKARASAIIEDVSGRRISYAVTKRGAIEALIVPPDAGERLVSPSAGESAWEVWQSLAHQLARNARGRKARSALEELDRMRR
jgi:antitoxin (DNA-binding transcriptional repressor) of toxin-antitoxin stability system